MIEVLDERLDEVCSGGGSKGTKIIKGEIIFGANEIPDALTLITNRFGKLAPDPYRKPFNINIFNIRSWNEGQRKLYAINTEADYLATFTVSVEV